MIKILLHIIFFFFSYFEMINEIISYWDQIIRITKQNKMQKGENKFIERNWLAPNSKRKKKWSQFIIGIERVQYFDLLISTTENARQSSLFNLFVMRKTN